MAMESPVWLDTSFVQKVLQNAEEDDSIEVSGITVKAATAKGDNYSSDMHRVTVKFSRIQDGHEIQKETSFIVKVVPHGDVRQEMIVESGIFETELSMMSVTLPLMNEILEREKLESTPLGARCLKIQYEKPTYIIFEDLVRKSFRMAERQAGLDLDHSLLAIQNLARFHAASIALKEKDSTALENYNKPIFHKDQSRKVQAFFNSIAKVFANETAEWPIISPCIKEKLVKLSEVLFEKACEGVLFREDDFNVLNHGDFWINNMLFRYDEQLKPIDQIFVDFQLSYYGSPAVDLLYFFGTSPTDEVRYHHRELLLRKYHASLTSTMVKLECTTRVLSFDTLQEALTNRAIVELVAAMTVLPLVVLEKGEEIDVDEALKQGKELSNVGFRGKKYRKIMTRLLPWFDSMGLLDV